MNYWPGTSIPMSRGNGFDWNNGESSMFFKDKQFNKAARNSAAASASVAAAREQGRDLSTIYGLSGKADELVAGFKRQQLSFDPQKTASADKQQRIQKASI